MGHTWHRLNAGLLSHPGAGTPKFLLGGRQQTPPTPGGGSLWLLPPVFIFPAFTIVSRQLGSRLPAQDVYIASFWSAAKEAAVKLRRILLLSVGIWMVLATTTASLGQSQSGSPAKDVRDNFFDINRKILDMARDFPEDKYGFRLKPEMRSFGEVIVHVASGIVYAAKKGRGENVKWTELDPKDYKSKAEIVAMLEKAISDSAASIKALPDDSFSKSVEPWLDVTEHSAEHYGLLVAYYRANGIVPPESRPKK